MSEFKKTYLARDVTPPTVHSRVQQQRVGRATAKKTIILNNSYKEGCITDVGKGMAGLFICGLDPEDNEMGILQPLEE